MPINLGSSIISTFKLGTASISQIYLGLTPVSNAVAAPLPSMSGGRW